MTNRIDHNKLTRARARKALGTDERNVSKLSDDDVLKSAFKDSFRANYSATKASLTRGRRKKAAEQRYQREQSSVDSWLEKHTKET